jgi:hypothetical protein
MRDNRPWVLRALGHTECVAAIKAERRAARRFWVRFNPGGCAEGSVLAECVGPLAEEAHKRFTPKVRDRRREAAEGYRYELLGPAEWDAKAKPCLMGQCEHRAAKRTV